MDHRHFEAWLHNDTPLTPEQRRALEAHLRTCRDCAAAAEVNLALRRVGMARPAAGFGKRFQARLAARKAENRRRDILGVLALVLGAVGLLLWLVYPLFLAFGSNPATLFAFLINYLIFLTTSAQALSQAGPVVLRVLGGVLPAFAWMILLSALAGSATLWSFTLWKTTQVTRHV